MGYVKESLDFDDLSAETPMQPIRLEYLTCARDIAIQTDVLQRLGLVHGYVGQTLYALNIDDSIQISIEAHEQLYAEGIEEPDELRTHQRVLLLLTTLVLETAGTSRSTHRDPLLVAQISKQMRDEANAILLANDGYGGAGIVRDLLSELTALRAELAEAREMVEVLAGGNALATELTQENDSLRAALVANRTPTDAMVERAARALCDWDNASEEARRIATRCAHAALTAALQEPR